MRSLITVVGLVGATSIALACSSSKSMTPTPTVPSTSTSSGSDTIAASSTTSGGSYGSGGNYFFTPTTDTVAAGTAVTFTFGSVVHNVVFETGPSILATIPNASNTSAIRTFATAGTYTFHCTIHNFSGTVVAQ
jgi:plastocyanin